METVAILMYIIFFLMLAGFSSGYETGLISIPVMTIEAKTNLKKKSYAWLLNRIKNLERLVSVTLITTNFALTSAVLLFLLTLTKRIQESSAEIVTILVLTPLSIIFSEIIPKSIFRAKPELIFYTEKIFRVIYYVMYPLTYIFYFFPVGIINILTKKPYRRRVLRSKEQIKIAITKSEERGLLEGHETASLYKALDLGKKQVKEMMIPIKKVIYLNMDLNMKEAFDEFKKYEFSRLPVYDTNDEEFIGLINYMDFLIQGVDRTGKITELMHPIIHSDDNAYLDDLLIRMLKDKVHLVEIKNSLAMTVGIVTLEDVLEEIVGEY